MLLPSLLLTPKIKLLQRMQVDSLQTLTIKRYIAAMQEAPSLPTT